MVPEKIFEILKVFTTNDYKSILIDGVWCCEITVIIYIFKKFRRLYSKSCSYFWTSLLIYYDTFCSSKNWKVSNIILIRNWF